MDNMFPYYDLIQFVNPRVNPVRSDACVQTHQSEMVNPFDDDDDD